MTERAWETYALMVEWAHRHGWAPPLPPDPLGDVCWHLRYCSEGDERCTAETQAFLRTPAGLELLARAA